MIENMVEKVARRLHLNRQESDWIVDDFRADWESLSEKARYEFVSDALAAIEAMAVSQSPVAWRIRRGDSDVWGYTENESDADFLGGAGGVSYVKEPLYAALTEGTGE